MSFALHITIIKVILYILPARHVLIVVHFEYKMNGFFFWLFSTEVTSEDGVVGMYGVILS